MREALLQFEEICVKLHRMLVDAYGDCALSETTCRDWFRRFKDVKIDLGDKKRENHPRMVKDHKLHSFG